MHFPNFRVAERIMNERGRELFNASGRWLTRIFSAHPAPSPPAILTPVDPQFKLTKTLVCYILSKLRHWALKFVLDNLLAI